MIPAQVWRRLGVGVIVGIACVGCGLIDQPQAEEAIADPRGIPVTPDAEQKARFQSMHNQVTVAFINQPLFGMRRMWGRNPPDTDIVHASTPNPTPDPDRKLPVGWVKMINGKPQPEIEGIDFQQEVKWLDLDQLLKPLHFRRVQLVGLVMHPGPVAYETDNIAMGADTADIPTRTLDAFEEWGLKKLKAGDDLYLAKLNTGEVRVLGPIYAGAKCVGCHSPQGQMLGAFSYTFETAQPKATPPNP